MFTGIVEEMGVVEALAEAGGGRQLSVRARGVLQDLKLGDSVAVDGACLTITRFDASGFTVGLSPETLRRTTLGDLRRGDRVNLERALQPTGRMGGHYVQGHVDGMGVVSQKRREGDSVVMRFTVPAEIGRYIVEKGFIAVDGISLTVTGCGPDWFSVALIPFTRQAVVLPGKGVGDKVNLEVDIIAKYVESFLARRGESRPITPERLAEEGFV